MVKIKCADYGFECDFVMEVKPPDLLEKFGAHMTQIYGIEYQKEVLMTVPTSKLSKKS